MFKITFKVKEFLHTLLMVRIFIFHNRYKFKMKISKINKKQRPGYGNRFNSRRLTSLAEYHQHHESLVGVQHESVMNQSLHLLLLCCEQSFHSRVSVKQTQAYFCSWDSFNSSVSYCSNHVSTIFKECCNMAV